MRTTARSSTFHTRATVGASVTAHRSRPDPIGSGAVPAGAASGSALTPAESRVAELVVEGKTNHEVAQALFVSEKTVEANLTRIYRKLDVRSRVALAARMREREAGEEPAKL